MDGAYNRALPEYLKPSHELEPVGLFRSVVREVYADCEAQMVRVVVTDMGKEDAQRMIRCQNPTAVSWFLMTGAL